MENSPKANVYFYVSLLCAVWFMLTSWYWLYGMNLLFSFPVGLLSLFLWYQGKKREGATSRFRIVPAILVGGVVTSIAYLFLFVLKQ